MKFSATSFQFACDLVLGAAHEPALVQAVARRADRGGRRARRAARAPRRRGRRRRGSPSARQRTAMEAVVGLVERLDVAHVEDRPLILRYLGVGREQRRAEAGAIEVVGPRVVRALEETVGAAALPRSQMRAPRCRQTLWSRAARPSRLLQTITERPATSTTRKSPGLGDLVGDTHRHPGAGEDLLALEREEVSAV